MGKAYDILGPDEPFTPRYNSRDILSVPPGYFYIHTPSRSSVKELKYTTVFTWIIVCILWDDYLLLRIQYCGFP